MLSEGGKSVMLSELRSEDVKQKRGEEKSKSGNTEVGGGILFTTEYIHCYFLFIFSSANYINKGLPLPVRSLVSLFPNIVSSFYHYPL